MKGQVIEMYIAAQSDAPAKARDSLSLEAGHGIVGDRHFLQQRTLEIEAALLRKEDITLISADELDAFNGQFELEIPYGDFRRNIVTRDIDLNALVGKHFRIGEVVCEGMELCEPCSKLARTVSRLVLPNLVRRGGLRAAVIVSGQIVLGDSVEEIAR